LNGKGSNFTDYPHLEITDTDGKALMLTPEFKRETKAYQLTVPYETSTIQAFGWNENGGGYVTVDGKLTQLPDIRQGKILREPVTIELEQGINIIDMVIGNMDGSSKVYTVMVSGIPAERNPMPSIVLSPRRFGSRNWMFQNRICFDVDNVLIDYD
jgi:hypothetical protein